MSAQESTPTPWPTPDTAMFNWANSGHEIKGGVLSLGDYLRARACVNACAGMDNPAAEIDALAAEIDALKADNATLMTVANAESAECEQFRARATPEGYAAVPAEEWHRLSQVEMQRDELVAALEAYVGKFGNCGSVYEDALAAIAKAQS